MAVPPPPFLKATLRTQLRDRRRAHHTTLVARHELDAASAAITARLLDAMPPGATVALYHPHGDEAAFPGLAAALAARGHVLALPVLSCGRPPRFATWQLGDLLEDGPYRIRQPAPAAATARPDLIVAPLLGFDERGGRLGQGGGHYDRLFAAYPHVRRLGCAWHVQQVAAVPLDAWDVALHAVVTDLSTIICGGPA